MNNSLIKICEVVDNTDPTDGGRIKVRLLPEDNKLTYAELPYVFPLLPKTLHIKPKIGEAVLVFKMDSDNSYNQRFYVGPIISQPQYMFNDSYNIGGQSLLSGSIKSPSPAPSTNPATNGAYPNNEDIAFTGRGDADIILKPKELQMRCGVHRSNPSRDDEITFNRRNPTYIKLNYDEFANETNQATATIVGDKILLLGNNGSKTVTTSPHDLLSNEEIQRIINESYSIPYGEKVVELFALLIDAFKTHTHAYHGLPPCQDITYQKVDSYDLSKLLSKTVKLT